jgi:indolepyruvate ferredoxin oxidoreductase beta subunit
VKQQIVISGLGGQGVLTLTHILAEAADAMGYGVITSETHGMAQRGGAVISSVKVGPFHGPLVAAGEADVGLFLAAENLPVHGNFLRPGGVAFVNARGEAGQASVDATALAVKAESPRSANLVLLAFAAACGGLFSDAAGLEATIRAFMPAKFLQKNLRAFYAGVAAAGEHASRPRVIV